MITFTSIIFWVCLVLLVYIYAGYLLALTIISLFHKNTHRIDENYTPSITILFSARNEHASLPDKFESLRNLDYPKNKLQLLIASDASTDGTNEFLLDQPDVETQILSAHAGKNVALNTLLPKATGEILFFTDANTILHPHALKSIAKHYSDPQTGCVTGNLVFSHNQEWNPVGRGTGLYWWYENGIKTLENRLGSVLVGGGSLLSARRELVHDLLPQVANDLEIPMRIGSAKYKVLYETGCVGFEKPHTSAWEEFRRTSRIVARGLRGFAVLFPLIAKNPFRLWQFISHKFLRWFTLPLSLGLLFSAGLLNNFFAGCIFYSGLALLAAAVAGMVALRLSPSIKFFKPFTLLAHLLIMHAGACWGLWMTLTGKTPAVWTIPQSSRENP